MRYSEELINSIKAFGLKPSQAEVYLAALELGPASVLALARHTGLPRTTIYPILEKLVQQGVFRAVQQKTHLEYVAAEPRELVQILAERETVLLGAIPELEKLQHRSGAESGVTMYEGTDGFKQLWKRILNSGVQEYQHMTNGQGILEYVKEPYIVERLIAERIKRGIKSFQLIPDSKHGRMIASKDAQELRESRFLPAKIKLPAGIMIFGDEVAFITTRSENTMILVASGEAAATHRELFGLLWDAAGSQTI